VPRRGIALPDLTGIQVFIAAGTNDPICPQQESVDLKKLLEDANASVGVQWVNTGHQLTMTEVEAAKQWYEQIYS